MPPKKSTRPAKPAAKPAATKDEASTKEEPKIEPQDEPPAEKKQEDTKPPSNKANDKKRKQPPSKPSTAEPSKAPRRGRSQPKPTLSAAKTLNFLLSPAARDLACPKDEREISSSTKTYTNTVPMSPFEELVCAVVLSRPIGHGLGQRTIRTIFNEPYNLTTPKAIKDLGQEKLHTALEEARTQHKAKTVEQLDGLAKIVIEKFADSETDTSLEKLRKAGEYDKDVIGETVRNGVKGVGVTAVNIFMRRVQGHWKECYPTIDERTGRALEGLGLPSEAEELRKVIEKEWKGLNKSGLQGKDEETKKRMAFVLIGERATGSELEGKTEEVLEHIRG